jgi:methionine synthase II (cobalamin-independent)
MPEHMVNRVSESVNKKSESPEEKLQKELGKLAQDIAIIEPEPKDWGWWVSYFLEQLEGEAERRGMSDIYKETLISLKQDLGNRIGLG